MGVVWFRENTQSHHTPGKMRHVSTPQLNIRQDDDIPCIKSKMCRSMRSSNTLPSSNGDLSFTPSQ